MIGKRVMEIGSGRTGTVIKLNGMCYDVRMDDTGETLSGGKKRWRSLHANTSRDAERVAMKGDKGECSQ